MIDGEAAASIPNGWMRILLGEVVLDIQSGFASGKHNSSGVGVIHMRPMNVSRNGVLDFSETKHIEDTSERRLRFGDVLFNNTNSAALVGKTAYVNSDIELAFSNHMTRVRTDGSRLEAKFLATQLHALWMNGYFEEICSNHVNQASVSARRLRDVEIKLPPVDEQVKIVEILDEQLSRLDAALASVRAMREKAAQFRRSLLHAAFNGALTGHDSSTEVLPNGWIEKQLGEVADVGWGDLQVTKSSFIEDGYLAYSAAGPDGFREDFDFDEDGIVLSAIGAGCGRTWYAEGRWSCIKNTIRILKKSDEVRLDFLYQQLSDPGAWPKRGSGQPFISQKDARELLVKVPSLSEQAKIVQIVEEQLSRLDIALTVADEIESMTSKFRRSLLHAAFTGNLTKEWREHT